MKLYLALLAGNGKEYLGDAMADVVANHVVYEKHGEEDAHHGVYQIKPVGSRHVELLCEEVLYLADEPFQQQTSQRSEDTHQKTDDEDELVGGKVCPSPFEHNGQ